MFGQAGLPEDELTVRARNGRLDESKTANLGMI